MIKKITAFIAILILMLTITFTGVFGAITVPKSAGFYVNDFAHVLNSQIKDTIEGFSLELEQKTGAQLVIVIPESLQDAPVNDYANTLFREWGIGQKNKDNGWLHRMNELQE